MRVLKFRVWDTKGKKWLHYVTPKEYMLDCQEWSHHDMEDESCLTYPGNIQETFNGRLVWQQFTGLKTPEGKEIYEGDIVKTTFEWQSKTFAKEDYYKKGPFSLEPVKSRIHIGEVVFSDITDVDDYYCPVILGWGITEAVRLETGYKPIVVSKELASVTSLKQALVLSACGLTQDCYHVEVKREFSVIGNVFENPELLLPECLS